MVEQIGIDLASKEAGSRRFGVAFLERRPTVVAGHERLRRLGLESVLCFRCGISATRPKPVSEPSLV